MRRLLLLPLLFLLSCAPAVTPTATPPNSPQTQVADINKAVADADQAAVETVISLRDAGKLSQVTAAAIENWLAFVAITDKSIGLILEKPEAWAQQKNEIYGLLLATTAPAIAVTIDPAAQTVITQIATLLAQMKVQVAP